MSEADAIQRADGPRTRTSLGADLRRLGVAEGMTLLVHSSLSSLGWVCGGPVAVIQALLDALGPAGNLVMPAHTGEYSDPAGWENPPVPESWWPIIRAEMPAFDPAVTPTRGMGQIAETFRTWPGAKRSSRPSVSFIACGPDAEAIIEGHSLDYPLGDASPIGRLCDRDGCVLLLGVGYDRCTLFHLAEYRTPGAQQVEHHAPVLENGERVWKRYRDIDGTIEVSPGVWTNAFTPIGEEMDQTDIVKPGFVGSARARLFPARAAVDIAARRMAELRSLSLNKAL